MRISTNVEAYHSDRILKRAAEDLRRIHREAVASGMVDPCVYATDMTDPVGQALSVAIAQGELTSTRKRHSLAYKPDLLVCAFCEPLAQVRADFEQDGSPLAHLAYAEPGCIVVIVVSGTAKLYQLKATGPDLH